MEENVRYKVGDIYNNKVITRIFVNRRMNPRRKDRFGHYIEWKNFKTGKTGKCRFDMFGRNHPRTIPVSGVNDIATTAPWMVPWLKDQSIAYTHTVTSSHLVDWICPYCGLDVYNKAIDNCYYYKKVTCPYCSDGVSYPERYIANLLKLINVKFDFQREFDWSDGKIYDFYIPSLHMIIETHGRQHYTNTWSTGVDKNQKMTIQENDAYKLALADKHGISCYVVLDCRHSDGEYIRKNIINSALNTYFDLSSVDWYDVSMKSLTSVFIQAIDLLRSNVDGSIILSELHISSYTLNRYVKRAKKIGLLPSDYKCPVPWNISSITKQIQQEERNGRNGVDVYGHTYTLFEQVSDAETVKISLTNNDIETACWLINGVSPHNLAILAETSYDAVCARRGYLYKKLKIHSKKELCGLYENDINFRNIIDTFYIQNQHTLLNNYNLKTIVEFE